MVENLIDDPKYKKTIMSQPENNTNSMLFLTINY